MLHYEMSLLVSKMLLVIKLVLIFFNSFLLISTIIGCFIFFDYCVNELPHCNHPTTLIHRLTQLICLNILILSFISVPFYTLLAQEFTLSKPICLLGISLSGIISQKLFVCFTLISIIRYRYLYYNYQTVRINQGQFIQLVSGLFLLISVPITTFLSQYTFAYSKCTGSYVETKFNETTSPSSTVINPSIKSRLNILIIIGLIVFGFITDLSIKIIIKYQPNTVERVETSNRIKFETLSVSMFGIINILSTLIFALLVEDSNTSIIVSTIIWTNFCRNISNILLKL